MPILLVSYPKSGTHLLNQILYGLLPPNQCPIPQPFFSVYESNNQVRTEDDALTWLDSLAESDIASSHLYAWDRVTDRVRQADFITYFLYRDPRNICVSYVRHVMEVDLTHYHHDYYSALPNFSERLMTSILDVPGANENISNIAKRFSFYLGWMNYNEVLNIRFEDLIHDRRNTLIKIISHFESRMSLETNTVTPESLEACIDPAASPTFGGDTGTWERYFTEAHKETFKDVCGDLLIKLGYEKDNDW